MTAPAASAPNWAAWAGASSTRRATARSTARGVLPIAPLAVTHHHRVTPTLPQSRAPLLTSVPRLRFAVSREQRSASSVGVGRPARRSPLACSSGVGESSPDLPEEPPTRPRAGRSARWSAAVEALDRSRRPHLYPPPAPEPEAAAAPPSSPGLGGAGKVIATGAGLALLAGGGLLLCGLAAPPPAQACVPPRAAAQQQAGGGRGEEAAEDARSIRMHERARQLEVVAEERTPQHKRNIAHLLSANKLFRELPEDARIIMTSLGQYTQLPAGEVVFREGEEGNRFYMVLSGSVRVLKKGRDVARLQKGMGFGELALTQGGDAARQATVVVHEDCELFSLDRESFFAVRDLQHRQQQEQTANLSFGQRQAWMNKAVKGAEDITWTQRLELELESIFMLSTSTQLLMLVGTIGMVIMVGGLVYTACLTVAHQWATPRFVEGCYKAFSFVTNAPGTSLHEESGVGRIVAALLFIVGLFAMSVFIGVVSEGINGYMQRLQDGHNRIVAKQHTVVLGWSSLTVPLVQQLSRKQPSHGALTPFGAAKDNHTIAVLSFKPKSDMEQALREVPGGKIMCRTGDIAGQYSQDQVSTSSADSLVFLLPTARVGGGKENTELLEQIELLAVLTARAQSPDGGPSLIVETQTPRGRKSILQAGGDRILALDRNTIVGNHLVRCAFSPPGLHDVYQELLSSYHGCASLFTIKPEQHPFAGMRWGEVKRSFPHAVPMGLLSEAISTAGDPTVYMAPEDSRILQDHDHILVLAHDEKGLRPQAQPQQAVPTSLPMYSAPAVVPSHVLVLGYNGSVAEMLNEMDEMYEAEVAGVDCTILSHMKADAVMEDLRARELRELRQVKLKVHRENPSNLAAIEKHILNADLKGQKQIRIIAVSDESAQDGAMGDEHMDLATDSRVLGALLQVTEVVKNWDIEPPHTVAQMIAQTNARLVGTANSSTQGLVTNELYASVLANATGCPNTVKVWTQLLSATWGFELYLKRADRYVAPTERVSFNELAERASKHGEVALGFRRAETGKIELNPAHKAEANLELNHPDDTVIVLAMDGRLAAHPDQTAHVELSRGRNGIFSLAKSQRDTAASYTLARI